MKLLLLALAVLPVFVACERHSWDETRKLHLHEAHGDVHHTDTGHGAGEAAPEEGMSAGGGEP